MAVNKVLYGGNTLIDLTNDTVTADTLAEGATAHDRTGNVIRGTATFGGGVNDLLEEIQEHIGGTTINRTVIKNEYYGFMENSGTGVIGVGDTLTASDDLETVVVTIQVSDTDYGEIKFTKLSNSVPTIEVLENGYTITGIVDGQTVSNTYPYNNKYGVVYGIVEHDNGTITIGDGLFEIATKDVYLDSLNVTLSSGIWAVYMDIPNDVSYQGISLTIPNANLNVLGKGGYKIKPEYLPSGVLTELPKAEAIADLKASPTMRDFNNLLAALRKAGYLAI